jgi:hypothetical protein
MFFLVKVSADVVHPSVSACVPVGVDVRLVSLALYRSFTYGRRAGLNKLSSVVVIVHDIL